MEKGKYAIDVSPLQHLRKSLKEKPEIKLKLAKAKTIINAKLLSEIKKEFKIQKYKRNNHELSQIFNASTLSFKGSGDSLIIVISLFFGSVFNNFFNSSFGVTL